MADVTIIHNPNCSTSRFAIDEAKEAGTDVDVVKYLNVSERLDRASLAALADKLEDPVGDMVRRDQNFKKLELTEADVDSRDKVLDLLAEHPELLQRPILVRGDRAIIGRPKDRVAPFLAG